MLKIKDSCREIFLVGLVISLLAMTNEARAEDAVVRVCDDVAEYPPYVVRSRDDKSKAAGATHDLLAILFERMGIRYKVDLLPWKRCLVSVEQFSSSKGYEAFVNASYSNERAEKYLVSQPLYSISNAYWYDQRRHKQQPLNGLSNVGDFSFCSMRGYNTEWLSKVAPKVKFEQMNSYDAGFRMMESGRCDLMLGAIPVIRGLEQINGKAFSSHSKPVIFPEALANTYHLYVSRNSPRGEELIQRFNETLAALQAENIVEEIYREYLPECGTDC